MADVRGSGMKPSPRYVAIDVETTGLDPCVHSICQIGAVIFDLEYVLGKFSVDVYVDMELHKVDPKALQVNKFTEERLIDATHPRDALNSLEENLALEEKELGPLIFVFHNAIFDVAFLRALMQNYGEGKKYPTIKAGLRRVLDTVTMAYVRFPYRPLMSLSEIAKEVLPEFAWDKHDALEDARATAYVAMSLMRSQRGLIAAATGRCD